MMSHILPSVKQILPRVSATKNKEKKKKKKYLPTADSVYKF